MLHSEKVDFTRFYECKNSQKQCFILDSVTGSGTTAAVAHKMNRIWIGVEMGDHAYSHCKIRLDKVIDGSDKGWHYESC